VRLAETGRRYRSEPCRSGAAQGSALRFAYFQPEAKPILPLWNSRRDLLSGAPGATNPLNVTVTGWMVRQHAANRLPSAAPGKAPKMSTGCNPDLEGAEEAPRGLSRCLRGVRARLAAATGSRLC